MPEFIPRSEQRPIVDTSSTTLDLIYFDLVTLASNEQDIRRLPAHESLYVVLSGQVDIEVDGIMFEAVGRRADIWGGDADSVYAPVGANVRISARGAAAEVAIAGGLCDTRYAPFRITPDEVDAVNVGSSDTHSQRRIVHLLGQRQNGRCGNLL
ncbi:5-deoxy-glucuronate isomerase, partial [Rhizobium ruizarguesonis]